MFSKYPMLVNKLSTASNSLLRKGFRMSCTKKLSEVFLYCKASVMLFSDKSVPVTEKPFLFKAIA